MSILNIDTTTVIVTRNHVTDGDYVTVCLVVQEKETKLAEKNRIDTLEGTECSLEAM